MTRTTDIAAQLKSIFRAEAGGRPEASLEFVVFGEIFEDSIGFWTFVWAVVFSTDTSKYDADDGSNLMFGKILWESYDWAKIRLAPSAFST